MGLRGLRTALTLKRLIVEADEHRSQLSRELRGAERALPKARRRLALASGFVFRLALKGKIPARAAAVEEAQNHVDALQAEIEGSFVEIDFGLTREAQLSYLELCRAFEAVSGCAAIWDLTSIRDVDQVKERSAASMNVRRTRVRFAPGKPDLVRTSDPVLDMGNVRGRFLQIYPAFLMMRDDRGEFALVEYRELEAVLRRVRFHEVETPPADAQIVGHTWKKANKDGSRDKRFADNSQIPIALYADLTLKSPQGLFEEYEFSDFAKGEAFARCLQRHAATVSSAKGAAAASAEPADSEEPAPEVVPLKVPEVRGLWMDWIAVAVASVALVAGGSWVGTHQKEIAAAFAPKPPPPVAAPAPAVQPPKAHRIRHRRRKHAPAATTAPSADATSGDAPSPPADGTSVVPVT